jgi:ABC-type transport system involved in cytochrome c biogenesis permease subunit
MDAEPTLRQARRQPLATACALVLLAAGLGALVWFACQGMMAMGVYLPPQGISANAFIGAANLLLMAASVLYLVHPWLDARWLGRSATGLAGAGLAVMVVGLLVRATETLLVPRFGRVALTTLSDVVSLFSAATVFIYLVMERSYRSRSAGAFVMPIVAVAVLFNARLMAAGRVATVHRMPVLGACLMCAHVVTGLVAYSCFAVAAGLGVMVLRSADAADGDGAALHPRRIERLMHRAVFLGVLLFTLALAFGAATGGIGWERCKAWQWGAKETASSLVWANYALYVALYRFKRWRGARMAWWTIAAFVLTLASVAVVRLWFSGLHSNT